MFTELRKLPSILPMPPLLLSGCLGLTEEPERQPAEPLVKPWTKPIVEVPYTLERTEVPQPLSKTAANQEIIDWYQMNGAQCYDVAVGSRDHIYIINNNRD